LCLCGSPYTLNCRGDAMIMFHKLCRIAYSSRADSLLLWYDMIWCNRCLKHAQLPAIICLPVCPSVFAWMLFVCLCVCQCATGWPGCLPVTRCLFSAIGILSADHQPDTVSLLINSGLLALTQTVLRLCGLFAHCAFNTCFYPEILWMLVNVTGDNFNMNIVFVEFYVTCVKNCVMCGKKTLPMKAEHPFVVIY